MLPEIGDVIKIDTTGHIDIQPDVILCNLVQCILVWLSLTCTLNMKTIIFFQ